jgi:heme/copper-type cytochrome/quinol oxidase subunit 2
MLRPAFNRTTEENLLRILNFNKFSPLFKFNIDSTSSLPPVMDSISTLPSAQYLMLLESIMLQEQDLPFGSKRLLEVTERLIVPSNVSIRFLVTSSDVIHS